MAALTRLATETEKTAEQFRRDKSDLDGKGRYYRFNVSHGLENVGLAESKRQREIAAATGRYVALQDVYRQLKACANGLARKQYFGPFKTPFSLDGVPASDNYVARPHDTAELEKYLLPTRSYAQQTRRKVFVLSGLGGIGKTQLAIDFARRCQAMFSSVFWFDGRSEDQLKRSIAGCIAKIPKGQIPEASRHWTNSHTQSQDELDDAVAAVVKWLGQPDNTDWLLIFDNIDKDWIDQEPGTGAYDPRRYLPGDHGSVLITTRLSRLAQLGESRKLGQVSMALGKAILERWFGGELSSDCENLLKLLHGLPLALAQAGSYLREKSVDVTTYVRIYNKQWDELMGSRDVSDRPLLDYNQGSVRTTWTVSFREIQNRSPDAAKLLRLWAFLDNKQLWHGLLIVTSNRAKPQYSWPQWLSEIGCNELRFLDAIGLLLRYSMIETEQGSKDSYSVHPVVHQWALYLDEEWHKDEWVMVALAVVGQSVSMEGTKECWALHRKLIPHAEATRIWIQSIAERCWCIGDELVLDSLHMLGHLYANQEKFAEAEAMYKRALEGFEKVLGRDHPKVYSVRGNLRLLQSSGGTKLTNSGFVQGRSTPSMDTPERLGENVIAKRIGPLGNLSAKLRNIIPFHKRARE
ncbi:tetratricopeptide repeat domain-containing protein [Fusarium denticulatum]|uniref:Tetratricopeptide repeat domain-containing protein n=1 Tax=Fusarium denticulatum TaxID=48507 RepID=A0A8H5WNY7_9HYPO|nr:tetratricopeptide repeat domain-containing protein [Fusarium denticulatum]